MDPLVNYLQARVNTCLVEVTRLYQEVAIVSRLLAQLQASINQATVTATRQNAIPYASSERVGDYLSRGVPLAADDSVLYEQQKSPTSERQPLRSKISSLGRKN